MKYIHQNICSVTKGVIAHGCNCQGVMGAGVAKALRDKYPNVFTEYAAFIKDWKKSKCEDEDLLGLVNFVNINESLIVANCLTQQLHGRDGRYAVPDAIKTSLSTTFYLASSNELPLYLPKIGAGLGGLDWEQDVEPIVSELATSFKDVDTYVCVWP